MLLIAALLFMLGNQPVELEEAITPEQKNWGLMGRRVESPFLRYVMG